MVKQIRSKTAKPMIITEFGQLCCDTNGSCFDYNGGYDGKAMGYDEAIMSISQTYNVSWTAWAWRPEAANYEGHKCQDVNADGGSKLANPTDGKGADWLTLWSKYANSGATTCPADASIFLQ